MRAAFGGLCPRLCERDSICQAEDCPTRSSSGLTRSGGGGGGGWLNVGAPAYDSRRGGGFASETQMFAENKCGIPGLRAPAAPTAIGAMKGPSSSASDIEGGPRDFFFGGFVFSRRRTNSHNRWCGRAIRPGVWGSPQQEQANDAIGCLCFENLRRPNSVLQK